MTFDEVLDQVRELLQREGRVSYRALKRRFGLDDNYLEDLKDELIKAKQLARDEEGAVLVWTAKGTGEETGKQSKSVESLASRQEVAERRQLTVMFCDLVGSTALSEQLDPEELREVVRTYQQASAAVLAHYDGHIAQYLGDGLLVYFGYPMAHEDDAARAVRAGLGIVEAVQQLNTRLSHPIHVRIGIHTGQVVVGEMGGGGRQELLALGKTPNIAARLQGIAEPDGVVISQATYRLIAGLFEYHDVGPQVLKGISTPLPAYRVLTESAAQSRFEATVKTGLTPLVGRDHEVGLLRDHWERAKQGEGQVVLLSGEPGIGKSRLVQELKEHVVKEGATRIEFRCSPYHQNSAFYPIIDHLQRLLQFEREDAPSTKLEKLHHTLSHYRFPQADTLPLLAASLSLPHPEGSPPITMSPQRQKERTQAALVAWLLEETERQPVYNTWEDVHWADPSTLEVLTLFLNHVPTARLLALLTFRPEFNPPWGNRSYINQMTLSRLGRRQVEAMVEQVTGGKALPPEVLQQIVAKTDGVPLFVEELTKTVLESVESIESIGSIGSVESIESIESGRTLGQSLLQLGIPATLHDALMARLDRLGATKELAQLGATLGREFSYELLHAVSPLDEERLQQGLKQLVEAELLYQRGLTPQATYFFKHALIQDAAYQSLLKSKRQQLHQQIAQVLEERFPDTKETQPELLARHYTEADLIEQAIPYWQQAGQRAAQRSANIEAISHLTTGLELLKLLPDTPERVQQELTLQLSMGVSLAVLKGYSAPETEHAYARALVLCRQIGNTPQIFPVLQGLQAFHWLRAEHETSRALAEQLLTLAQRTQNPKLLFEAHCLLGQALQYLGELTTARQHLEQGLALYNSQQTGTPTSGVQPIVQGLTSSAHTLWYLGYPEQAMKQAQEALSLAQASARPFALTAALYWAAEIHLRRREGEVALERLDACLALAAKHEFTIFLASGILQRGGALIEQGRLEEGIVQIRQGLAAWQAMGAVTGRQNWLALLAEAYGQLRQSEAGLAIVSEALETVQKTGARLNEAQLYRLKGELLLTQEGHRLQARGYREKTEEAEACFHKAIDIARKQQAKSLELRAVMSLSRLWQHQGKKDEARQMLAEIYGWFTEGFDTKDLQEAKALLDSLASRV